MEKMLWAWYVKFIFLYNFRQFVFTFWMRGDMCDPTVKYLLFWSNSNQNWNVLIYFSETLHISTPNDRFFSDCKINTEKLKYKKRHGTTIMLL
jgi:hypothetical protein